MHTSGACDMIMELIKNVSIHASVGSIGNETVYWLKLMCDLKIKNIYF